MSLPSLMQAPIGRAATPDLALAVIAAGGLGSLGASWTPIVRLREQIGELQRGTDQPFCVNLVLAFDQNERVALCTELKVPVVSLSWGVDEELIAQLQAAGTTVLVQVGSLERARRAASAGANVLIVQGIEAGGHVESFSPLHSLIQTVRDELSLPLIAAGGIADSAGIAAAFAAGASGVALGTRFVATSKADAHPVWQSAIIEASADDAVFTGVFDIGWEDAPHRVIRNSTLASWEAAGEPDSGERPGEGDVVAETDGRELPRYGDDVPLCRTTGNVEALALYAGTSAGAIVSVDDTSELTERLVAACADR